MVSFSVELDFGPWTQGLRALVTSLDEEMDAAFREVGDVVVFAAKADHPYTDYSGDLTRTTRAYVPRGRLSRGDLAVEIVAREQYASYVMRRRGDWLMATYVQQQGRIEHVVFDALASAVRKAGLR